MEKLRVVSLSERIAQGTDACVGLEVASHGTPVTVGEVFDALKVYLDQHRDELAQRGRDSVRVSLIRAMGPHGRDAWRATHH